jgi:hypothetical protein
MSRTLELGAVKLRTIAGVPDTDASVQVASGNGPDGLEYVFVRVGALMLVLDPHAALELGVAITQEAGLVAGIRSARPS